MKFEDKIKLISYMLYKGMLPEYAVTLAKAAEAKTLDDKLLIQIKNKIEESLQACAIKKEYINGLLKLEAEGKLSDKNLITKAVCTDERFFMVMKKTLETNRGKLQKTDQQTIVDRLNHKNDEQNVIEYIGKTFGVKIDAAPKKYGFREEKIQKADKMVACNDCGKKMPHDESYTFNDGVLRCKGCHGDVEAEDQARVEASAIKEPKK